MVSDLCGQHRVTYPGGSGGSLAFRFRSRIHKHVGPQPLQPEHDHQIRTAGTSDEFDLLASALRTEIEKKARV